MAECAFCGQDRKLSDEHVWANWLLKLLPHPTPSENKTRILGSTRTGLKVRNEGLMGAPELVKVVCRPCNHGWMATLEEEAMRLLAPMIEGESLRLQVRDQRLLAFWAAKTMTMIEYTDDSTRVTTAAQRCFLYKNRDSRRLPAEVTAWSTAFDPQGVPGLRYHHRVVEAALCNSLAPGHPNFQQTTMMMGQMVLVVFSYTLEGFRYWRTDPIDPV